MTFLRFCRRLDINVGNGQRVYFANPAGIENILSRVTGGNPSDILGTLGVDGGANLFLLNPSGIVFGPNARLDVEGSFVASTANTIQFGNQGLFSASTPDVPPLLTVNPSAFLFNQITPGPIKNQSVTPAGFLRVPLVGLVSLLGLRVPDGRSLLLVGGDVSLDRGGLHALGGRVELAGLASSGTVGLNIDGNNLNLSFPEGIARADISFTDEAVVNAGGESGGDIRVWGRHVTLSQGSQIIASTLGSGAEGSLTVNASESVQLSGRSTNGQLGSGLFAQTLGTGDAGNLTISTRQLLVRDGALASSGTFGKGTGGSLTVNASESVQLIGTSADGRGSGLFSQADGPGGAGDLAINTRQLLVQNGARVSASTLSEGAGGNLTVNASELVQVTGESKFDGRLSSLSAQTQGPEKAGDLTINTRQLLVQNGAQIGVSTFGKGTGGSLTVNASESVQLIGTSADGQFGSGLFSQSAGTQAGDAGDLTINTRQLLVQNGARGVSVSTFGKGTGGSLTVNASESVQLIGAPASSEFDGGLFAQTRGIGKAGDLAITTQQLLLQDGAAVTVSSIGSNSGMAGDLDITVGSVRLDNSEITGRTDSGNGGNLKLRVEDLLLLRNTSEISTTAGITGTGGDGGNITIDVPFIVAVPSDNSDITANAFEGRGGFIQITAQGVFGPEPREQLTELSDITAFSQQNPELNGVVEINTPDVDPSQELANLPSEPVDAEIAQDCQAGGGKASSRFISSGSGGLPTNPYEPLDSGDILAEVQPPTQWRSNRAGAARAATSPKATPDRIVEAQGWNINKTGEVVLVTKVPLSLPQRGCHLH